jgi:hypothetical protein
MGWFRGERRLGAWLALVALVLQVGLSFGHVHGPAPDHALEVTSVNPDGSKDADPDHGDDHNYCPSCAFLRLLAGAQIGAISASPLPVWQAAEHVIQAVETTRPGNTQALFRARAPPLA